MKYKTYILLTLLLMTSTMVHGQIKLQMYNGKVRDVASYKIRNERVYYVPTYDTLKSKSMDVYRIFAITDSMSGSERMLYEPDTSEGDMTAEEMRIFIEGEQYALTHYKNTTNKVVAAGVGVTGGLLAFYGPVVPAIYGAIAGRFSPKLPMNPENPPLNYNNVVFKDGFQYKARKMKTRDNFIFGGIGFAVGFTVFAVILSAK